MRRMMFAVFLFCFIQAYAKDPEIPEALLNAKIAYVQRSGASEKDFTKLCEALKKWGRFELVQERKNSDITIMLSSTVETRSMERPGASGGMMSNVQVLINHIRIMDARNDTLLWTDETSVYEKDPKILVSKLKSKMKKK